MVPEEISGRVLDSPLEIHALGLAFFRVFASPSFNCQRRGMMSLSMQV
jgi:hypothetical protein